VLTVIGEALIDLVESGIDAGGRRMFTAHPGGSPLNVAVGLARLGVESALLARLGRDAFGRVLREHAAGNGVDLRWAIDASEPSTLAVVSLDEQGRAAYDFYLEGTADWQWQPAELAGLPAEATILHTGSLAAWTPPGDAVIDGLLARVRADGRVLISYDPNVRPRLLGDPEIGRERVERAIARVHLVKASDEDIAWLYPQQSIDEVAAAWLDLGAGLVVVTRGADGAQAFRRGRAMLSRPARPIVLVDTVGAGDAFTGGLLAAIAEAGVDSPAALSNLDDSALAGLLDYAILVSALTCERAGADPPTRDEVLQALGE
jgi:fructokinase